MAAPELRIRNRAAYFRKAIKSPDFSSESVLTRDGFKYAELWLKRECKEALPFWNQAESYYLASKSMSLISAPLVHYYCFLNAIKALLLVKNIRFTERHGVTGTYDPTAKRSLSGEKVNFLPSGILAALSQYLEEPEKRETHSLTDLLANLPFIHRTYRLTYKSFPELFIPVTKVIYRKHPQDPYVWLTANISGRFADNRSLNTIPESFEVDRGYENECVIRSKKRKNWYSAGDVESDKVKALARLNNLHRKMRLDLCLISAPLDLWYLKRKNNNGVVIQRYGMTIIAAVMHRLSELSRYDPKGLSGYLEGRTSWLLTEFIQLAPAQFLDELICEMTSLEFRIPGVRP